jgi:hypothetical protein
MVMLPPSPQKKSLTNYNACKQKFTGIFVLGLFCQQLWDHDP